MVDRPAPVNHTPAAVQVTAHVNNTAVRLDALQEVLPSSSLGERPLRSQLAALGILSEVQVLYGTLEIHNHMMKVNKPLSMLLLTISELSASVWRQGSRQEVKPGDSVAELYVLLKGLLQHSFTKCVSGCCGCMME